MGLQIPRDSRHPSERKELFHFFNVHTAPGDAQELKTERTRARSFAASRSSPQARPRRTNRFSRGNGSLLATKGARCDCIDHSNKTRATAVVSGARDGIVSTSARTDQHLCAQPLSGQHRFRLGLVPFRPHRKKPEGANGPFASLTTSMVMTQSVIDPFFSTAIKLSLADSKLLHRCVCVSVSHIGGC
jgi:hypothetical protein